MGQALYRKYRSRTFDEVVGQEHITKTLAAAIKAGRISHAYLFTGPRGVGKTSVARILAREVNGLAYDGEETHLDIIEIDAASNRRIDEIRDLRDKVHIAPTSSKYKVYIIDEVHMLTREAFNALLKTLEEPPAHVIFILATTEAHKLPETIVSRTQRHSFRAISPQQAKKHLAAIAKKEKIDVNDEALELLAEFGDGSFRDSISLLDQLSSEGGKIDGEAVRRQLGLPAQQTVRQLLELTLSGDAPGVLELLARVRDSGTDAASLARMLAKELRSSMKAGQNLTSGPRLLTELAQVTGSGSPTDKLEIALLTAAANARPTSLPSNPAEEPRAKTETPSRPPEPESKLSAQASNFDLGMWEDVLEEVKHQAASIYTALRLAAPQLEGGTLTLVFEFGLHQKKVNSAQAKATIAAAIEALSGDKPRINCLVDKELARTLKDKPAPDLYKSEPSDSPNSLQTINNIFGSTEVLES